MMGSQFSSHKTINRDFESVQIRYLKYPWDFSDFSEPKWTAGEGFLRTPSASRKNADSRPMNFSGSGRRSVSAGREQHQLVPLQDLHFLDRNKGNFFPPSYWSLMGLLARVYRSSKLDGPYCCLVWIKTEQFNDFETGDNFATNELKY